MRGARAARKGWQPATGIEQVSLMYKPPDGNGFFARLLNSANVQSNLTLRQLVGYKLRVEESSRCEHREDRVVLRITYEIINVERERWSEEKCVRHPDAPRLAWPMHSRAIPLSAGRQWKPRAKPWRTLSMQKPGR